MSTVQNLYIEQAPPQIPDIRLQESAPKLAKGIIAGLAGAADDPRYFQISVPEQPGNSGGVLVGERDKEPLATDTKTDTKGVKKGIVG